MYKNYEYFMYKKIDHMLYILNNICIHTHSGHGGTCNTYSCLITSLSRRKYAHGQLR